MEMILPILIVLSLIFYVYYKVAIIKSDESLTQRYLNAKSRICLGGFVIFFAINQYLFYQTKISLFIGIAFMVLGGLQVSRGLKEAKHYRSEWQRLHKK